MNDAKQRRRQTEAALLAKWAAVTPMRVQIRQVAMPSNIRVLLDESEAVGGGLAYRQKGTHRPHLLVERRWFRRWVLLVLFGCILWGGLNWLWCANASETRDIISAVVFGILSVASWVLTTYGALCGLVNRTRIVVTSGILTIRHGPLPALRSRTIPTAELQQLYCEKIEQTDSDGDTSRTYRLNAILKSGSKVDLLDLPEPDQAHYLEQLIENRLGIVDAAVDGECT
jgi:hypothetical protein